MSKTHKTINALLEALARLDESELSDVHNISRGDATPSTFDEAVFAWVDAGRPMVPDAGAVLAEWREDDGQRWYRAPKSEEMGGAYGTVWGYGEMFEGLYWTTGGCDNESLGQFSTLEAAKAAVDARLVAEGHTLKDGAE